MQIKVKILREGALLPTYKTDLAAGADLTACISAPVTIAPKEVISIPTGIAIEIPPGYEGQIRPRSSLGKQGLSIPNAPGTIDADYRGEVMILIINLSPVPHTIYPGDRVAQLVIAPVLHITFVEAEELSPTNRGTGGFGSTGRNNALQR